MANKNNFDFDNVDDGPLDEDALKKLNLMFSIGRKHPGKDFEDMIQNLEKLVDEIEDFTQFEKFEYKNALTMVVNLFYRYIDTKNVP